MINSKIFFLCQFTDYLTDRAGLATKSGRTSVYLQVVCDFRTAHQPL